MRTSVAVASVAVKIGSALLANLPLRQPARKNSCSRRKENGNKRRRATEREKRELARRKERTNQRTRQKEKDVSKQEKWRGKKRY
jgi:hypothetical protein